jgi:uncharacterized protein (TIGR03086 family)
MPEPSRTSQELIPQAAEAFSRTVHQVPADAWDNGTPCTDWSVRDVVNHLTGEHLWVPPLLAGKTLEDVGDAFDGDVLGDDPVAAWEQAITASVAAWRGADPDFPVHLSVGPTPASEYANQMLLDLVVHDWDLARGAGLDDTLDPELVAAVQAYVTTIESQLDEWGGVFAAPVQVPDDADAQTRLLAKLGRRP